MVVVAVDPVDLQEQTLAAEVQRVHRELLGMHDSRVHAHIEGDALLMVMEVPTDLPVLPPALRHSVRARVAQIVHEVTGRPVEGAFESSRPRPDMNITVLRLGPAR